MCLFVFLLFQVSNLLSANLFYILKFFNKFFGLEFLLLSIFDFRNNLSLFRLVVLVSGRDKKILIIVGCHESRNNSCYFDHYCGTLVLLWQTVPFVANFEFLMQASVITYKCQFFVTNPKNFLWSIVENLVRKWLKI